MDSVCEIVKRIMKISKADRFPDTVLPLSWSFSASAWSAASAASIFLDLLYLSQFTNLSIRAAKNTDGEPKNLAINLYVKNRYVRRKKRIEHIFSKLILDKLYEIANTNSDLKKILRFKKGIINSLLNTGCVALSQVNDRIAPFGDAYALIVGVHGVHFHRPKSGEKFSTFY